MAMAETTMKPTFLVAKLCTCFALPGSTLVWPKCPFIKKFCGIWTLKCHSLYNPKLTKTTGNPKLEDFGRRMRGGTDDNDLWMKTFGMSHALLSLVYAQNNTARCYCGRCYVEKSGWQENFILPVQLGALA